MIKQTVFVTGASGFIGSHIIRILLNRGFKVRAGVHKKRNLKGIQNNPDCKVVEIDVCSKNSLKAAFSEVDYIYHFAANVNSKLSSDELYRINVDGTRNVWETACQIGVKKALYCSSTAVYGLLSKTEQSISENIPARAVEPYGKSKLAGEKVVREISAANELKTIIIRPTAVFGSGEHTPFGRELRKAAFSKILLGGGFQNKKFSYVHVQDVTEAAIHLMQMEIKNGDIFNIAVNQPISYEEAFQAYLRALRRSGTQYMKLQFLGKISSMVEKKPIISSWLRTIGEKSFVFNIWRPGFDMTYSSQKLLSTAYRFRWNNFEDVIFSCIKDS